MRWSVCMNSFLVYLCRCVFWYTFADAGAVDNRNLLDDGTSQGLSFRDIEDLKNRGVRDQVRAGLGFKSFHQAAACN